MMFDFDMIHDFLFFCGFVFCSSDMGGLVVARNLGKAKNKFVHVNKTLI
jgi:hypothetical protein